MRIAQCVGLLALASLSCASDEKERHPELFRCPTPQNEQKAANGTLTYDSQDEVGTAHIAIQLDKAGARERAEVETGLARYVVQYQAGGAISWETLPRAPSMAAKPNETAPAPLELAPTELSKLIPDLQAPVDAACLARPDVSLYLGELRDRMHSRWFPPKLSEDADHEVRLLFSLTTSGEVTGACFVTGADVYAGASAVRALERASPYEPMERLVETDTDKWEHRKDQCLAQRRLTANFTVH